MFVVIATGWLIGYSLGKEYVINIMKDISLTNATFARERRASLNASPPKDNCNSWASWVNENHPSPSVKGDKEFVSQMTMHNFCPKGNVSKFECKDNKGEPFQGNFTASGGSYFISCSNITVGVICTVLDTTHTSFCPDMSIRYYCFCAPLNANSTNFPVQAPRNRTVTSTTSTLITSSTSITSTKTTMTLKADTTTEALRYLSTSTTREPRESSSTAKLHRFRTMSTEKGTSSTVLVDNKRNGEDYNQETMLIVGKMSIKWWIFLLVIAGTTFVMNTGISVCLYYRLKSRVNKKQSKKTVHPLQLI